MNFELPLSPSRIRTICVSLIPEKVPRAPALCCSNKAGIVGLESSHQIRRLADVVAAQPLAVE